MAGSAIVYLGLIVAAAGLALVVKPIPRLRVTTRGRACGVAGAGALLACLGLILPVPESRVTHVQTRLVSSATSLLGALDPGACQLRPSLDWLARP